MAPAAADDDDFRRRFDTLRNALVDVARQLRARSVPPASGAAATLSPSISANDRESPTNELSYLRMNCTTG